MPLKVWPSTADDTVERVDGCTLIPWQCGGSIIWDVTILDTGTFILAKDILMCHCVSGVAAEDASLRRVAKYAGVRQRYDFIVSAV